MVAPYNPPATRILSWNQLVREADPNFTKASLQPWVYQFSNGRLFLDTLPLYDDDAVAGLYNNGGVLGLDDPRGWPTSTAGLLPGAVWNNSGVPSVVMPTAPYPHAQPVFFGQTSAATLLALGGANLPITPPPRGSGQLWNYTGEIWIA